jgi:hypothetical protein
MGVWEGYRHLRGWPRADADWHRAFDDSIPVPDGRVLKTLHDAGHYVAALT